MSPQQPKSEERKELFPKLVLTPDDHAKMEGMTEAQKKLYIMRRQVRVYREGSLFNRRMIKNPEPGKHYMWVNSKEERRIFFESLDYKVVRTPNVGSNYWKEDEKQHRCADLILYELPQELHELYEADKIVSGLDRTDPKQAVAAFADAMRQNGVQAPVFQPNHR